MNQEYIVGKFFFCLVPTRGILKARDRKLVVLIITKRSDRLEEFLPIPFYIPHRNRAVGTAPRQNYLKLSVRGRHDLVRKPRWK